MNKRGLSQEGLKLIASVTMLIDHMGALLVYNWYIQRSYAVGMSVPWLWNLYLAMRIIGRIAFPIYCFLLVDGAHYTRNPRKYAGRLAFGALLSEIPFDLAFSGRLDWESSSVMVTLLLGYGMILLMQRVRGIWQLAVVVPFCLLADLLGTDYMSHGILIIAMLALTKNQPHEKLLRLIGFCLLLWFGGKVTLGPVSVPLEVFGIAAIVPLLGYKGQKSSRSKVLQWLFYLFYPIHLLLLWIIKCILFG